MNRGVPKKAEALQNTAVTRFVDGRLFITTAVFRNSRQSAAPEALNISSKSSAGFKDQKTKAREAQAQRCLPP